mmetsp:Transcript_6545/g.12198  ORF Transcript_6545/g.12198 Transcript_6545/m.12198 type:complete len:383 (+) Transcript_6545:115-1263(+)
MKKWLGTSIGFLVVFLEVVVAAHGPNPAELSSIDECDTVWGDTHGRRPSPSCSLGSIHRNALTPWLWPEVHVDAFDLPDFIHVAKTGGGTIMHVPVSRKASMSAPFSIGVTRFEDKDDKKTRIPGCGDGQTPPRNSPSYKKQPTFCVVRHPIDRLVSSMNMAAKKGRKTHAWMNQGLRKIAEYLLQEQNLRENNKGFMPETFNRASRFNSSFEPFRYKKLFAGFGPQHFCHMIPQADYIWDEAGQRTCSYVLRFEHLHAEYESLAKLYGINPFINVSIARGDHVGESSIVGKRVGTSSILSVLDHPSIIQHRRVHTFNVGHMEPDVLETFLNLYAADFCLLGYDTNLSAPVPPPLLSTTGMQGQHDLRKCACQRDSRTCIFA